MKVELLERVMAMLQFLPKSPQKITTQELYAKLTADGEITSMRSIQRDLLHLYKAGNFGIELDQRSKPYGWSYNKSWRANALNSMSAQTAIQFLLIKQVLEPQLAGHLLEPLSNYFAASESVLKELSSQQALNKMARADKNEAKLILALVKNSKIRLSLNRRVFGQTKIDKTYPNAEIWRVDYNQNPAKYFIRLSKLSLKISELKLADILAVELKTETAELNSETLTTIEIQAKCAYLTDRISNYLTTNRYKFNIDTTEDETLLNIKFNNLADVWRFVVFAEGEVSITSPNWVCKKMHGKIGRLLKSVEG